MKNAVLQQDSHSIQTETTHKKNIPKHCRPKSKIKSKKERYTKIDVKRDQSQGLSFVPFAFSRKMKNEEEVGQLKRTIKASSKIAKSFKFDLGLNEDLNSKVFSQISQEVKKAQGLRAFDIHIEGSDIYDPALKNLAIGLKPLKHLRYLKVRITECYEILSQGVIGIAMALRRLSSLETLDLRFENLNIDDEGVRALWHSLKYLKALKVLDISFHYCQPVAFEKIGNVDKIFQGLGSVKEINLNFGLAESLELEGLKNIAKTLQVLTGLEKIGLCLNQVSLSNEGLRKVMEGFRGKSKLKKVSLDIGWISITNEGLNYFKEGLKELNGIEEIRINLHRCRKITMQGVEDLKKSLEEISSLKHLAIKFEAEKS